MSRLLRRHRQWLASTALGLWTFALLVGIANACSWDGVTVVPHQLTAAAHAVDDDINHGMATDCRECCSNDVPLLGVLQQIQEPPAGQPLVVAPRHDLGFPPMAASSRRLARTAHPSPGVAFVLRTIRLTL